MNLQSNRVDGSLALKSLRDLPYRVVEQRINDFIRSLAHSVQIVLHTASFIRKMLYAMHIIKENVKV